MNLDTLIVFDYLIHRTYSYCEHSGILHVIGDVLNILEDKVKKGIRTSVTCVIQCLTSLSIIKLHSI